MTVEKKEILQQLQKDLLVLQGFKTPLGEVAVDLKLGPVTDSFPNKTFPVAAMHEFLSTEPEQASATSGFITGLLNGLMQQGKACVWISTKRTLFPPALKFFGVEPDQIIFIDLQNEKDLLWTMEEALKCEGLAAVVGEINNISFTASRRLQLAVEQSRVTGFLLRHNARQLTTIACVARWKINPLPTELTDSMPGVGFPRWHVELLKIRNGQPGHWQMEWSGGSFQPVYKIIPAIKIKSIRKAG
ncbi:MAG: Error-prone repair protein ImuA [Chitinophagaceae bacterium]